MADETRRNEVDRTNVAAGVILGSGPSTRLKRAIGNRVFKRLPIRSFQ
jgi:hypothetical protein